MSDLTVRDWERVERGLELLREKELRKARYGGRPEVFQRLFSKIAAIKQGAKD